MDRLSLNEIPVNRASLAFKIKNLVSLRGQAHIAGQCAGIAVGAGAAGGHRLHAARAPGLLFRGGVHFILADTHPRYSMAPPAGSLNNRNPDPASAMVFGKKKSLAGMLAVRLYIYNIYNLAGDGLHMEGVNGWAPP